LIEIAGNARLAGLEKDLGLHGFDYNQVLSAFYIGYIVFELPSVFACKLLGPGWYIPSMTIGFGIFSIVTAFCTNFHNISAVRFLLGVCEAGMLPGIAYYLSRWYRHKELALRLALYIVMAPLAGAFGGLLASGILGLKHFGSLRTWRMVFAIEGIITCGLGLVALCILPNRPESATWLSASEKDLAIARVKLERPGTTELIDKFNTPKIAKGLWNPVTLATSLVFLLSNITSQGLSFFTPTIVSSIYPGRSVVSNQLYTVPPYVVGAFFTLLIAYLSRRTGRYLVLYICVMPLLMCGFTLFLTSHNPTVRYAATFLAASAAFCFGVLGNALISANVISDTSRSAGIGLNSMCGNIGGLISTWSYLPFDKPDYVIGNGINLAASTARLLICALLWMWMIWDNKRRSRKDVETEIGSLSMREIQNLDWRNPAFRWKP